MGFTKSLLLLFIMGIHCPHVAISAPGEKDLISQFKGLLRDTSTRNKYTNRSNLNTNNSLPNIQQPNTQQQVPQAPSVFNNWILGKKSLITQPIQNTNPQGTNPLDSYLLKLKPIQVSTISTCMMPLPINTVPLTLTTENLALFASTGVGASSSSSDNNHQLRAFGSTVSNYSESIHDISDTGTQPESIRSFRTAIDLTTGYASGDTSYFELGSRPVSPASALEIITRPVSPTNFSVASEVTARTVSPANSYANGSSNGYAASSSHHELDSRSVSPASSQSSSDIPELIRALPEGPGLTRTTSAPSIRELLSPVDHPRPSRRASLPSTGLSFAGHGSSSNLLNQEAAPVVTTTGLPTVKIVSTSVFLGALAAFICNKITL